LGRGRTLSQPPAIGKKVKRLYLIEVMARVRLTAMRVYRQILPCGRLFADSKFRRLKVDFAG